MKVLMLQKIISHTEVGGGVPMIAKNGSYFANYLYEIDISREIFHTQ